MNVNWIVIPTLAGALLLFVFGQRSIQHCQTFKSKLICLLFFLVVGTPGFLFPLYYLHWFDNARWFYEFRSLPFSELTAIGSGLFAGALAEMTKDTKVVSRLFLIIILVLGIMIPHVKSIFAPVAEQRFSDRWEGAICMQSTPSSCGAASAATIFKFLGVSLSERDVARECFTYLGGTENWYITRAFRRRGFKVNYRIEEEFPYDLHLPAIVGIRVNGRGHFITIVEKSSDNYIVGDPMVGREEVPIDQVTKKFDFSGFFMEIQR